MVNIEKIKKNKYKITYTGEYFDEYTQISKDNQISFDYNDKCRYADKTQTYYFIKEASVYEPILNSEELLKECYPDDLNQFSVRPLKKDLFLAPPIQGKGENEKYQLIGIKKGVCSNRFANFDEQGLGKTYQIINILNHISFYTEFKKLLVVCPTNVIYNWRRELLRFSTFFKDREKCLIVDKENRDFLDYEENKKYDVFIMNYNTFRLCYDFYDKDWQEKKSNKNIKVDSDKEDKKRKITKAYLEFNKFAPKEEWAVVLDESHKIKNNDSLQSKMILKHKEMFEYRYILTGTPAPNNEAEIYNQIKFLDENVLGRNYLKFLRSLGCKGNRFSVYAIDKEDIKPEKVEEMYNKISNICVRRKSEDCLDLPPLTVIDNYCEFKKKHWKIYKITLKRRIMDLLSEDGYIDSVKVRSVCLFKQLNVLDNPRSVINDEEVIDKDNLYRIVENFTIENHSKFDVLDDLINKYVIDEKRKLIVWSYHPDVLDMLKDYYKKLNPYILHGRIFKVNDNKALYIDEINKKFKEDKKSNLFFASPKILKEGINMTYIERMIYFDRSMDLIEYLQSRKRLHRIGAENEVIQHNLIVENSVDEQVDKMLRDKEFLNTKLLNKKYFDIKDLEELFGDFK